MKKTILTVTILLSGLSVLISSCSKEEDEPSSNSNSGMCICDVKGPFWTDQLTINLKEEGVSSCASFASWMNDMNEEEGVSYSCRNL